VTTHYRLDATAQQVAMAFDADAHKDPWQGGPATIGQFAPVITGERRRKLRPLLWGFPPPPQSHTTHIEGLIPWVRNVESPFWIGTLRHVGLRCLVPATAFVTNKAHYRLPAEPVFAFAGVWRDTGEFIHFAILTTTPNALMKSHGRTSMPVILHPEDYDVWLSSDWRQAQRCIEPYPDGRMECVDRQAKF
jgi:putative SOS response-associated peptidase YedK